jgi:gas vesicle structural protein
MPIERTAPGANLIDILDRVLDKGVVIDAWLRVSLVGIELVTIEARIVVASLATYLQYSDVVGQASIASNPSSSIVWHRQDAAFHRLGEARGA